jgi:hypothetical protein
VARILSLLALSAVFACGDVQRLSTPPRVTALGPMYRAEPPAGETGDFVAIYLTLADDEENFVNLLVEVSRAGGAFVAVGSAGGGELAPGGEGVRGLLARRGGSLHRLLWKAPAGVGANASLAVRVTPSEPEVPRPFFPAVVGTPVTSAPFTLGGLSLEPR